MRPPIDRFLFTAEQVLLPETSKDIYETTVPNLPSALTLRILRYNLSKGRVPASHRHIVLALYFLVRLAQDTKHIRPCFPRICKSTGIIGILPGM